MRLLRGARGTLLALAAIGPHGAAQTPTLTTLYAFQGGTDGANPRAGLAIGANGALYGTTNIGGASDLGTVFALAPGTTGVTSWGEAVLYSFSGPDGENPQAGLVIGPDGAPYGADQYGGAAGVVFKLIPPASASEGWTETLLYSFTGGRDGGAPMGSLLVGSQGEVYGVTYGGGLSCSCGVVYQLTPPAPASAEGTPWTETVLYSFTGGSDGGYPRAGLTMGKDGILYGTTGSDGPSLKGTVFELTPPASPGEAWTETVLYGFTGEHGDGQFPEAGLAIGKNGALYGTTSGGGGSCPISFENWDGCGIVFELTPSAAGGSWTENVIYRFHGFPDGGVPMGPLALGANGAIYGATEGGGTFGCYAGPFAQEPPGCGVVFQLTPPETAGAAWNERVLHGFQAAADGARPAGGVILGADGTLYGTTSQNGKSQKGTSGCCGTVFSLTP
jgi:uncharacterized repeat protein (TIGR03803 family)